MTNASTEAPKSAFIGPRIVKEEGSIDWCWQTLDYLKYLWKSRQENVRTYKERIERELEGLRQNNAAAKIPPDKPYGDMDEMLRRELGLTSDQMRERITTELLVQARAEQPQVLNAPQTHNSFDNYQKSEGGTSADYLTARIARDRPDILDGMKQGKYRSVRAAAIDAGIIEPKQRYQLPTDAAAAGRYMANRVNKDWMLEFYDAYTKAQGE